MRFSLKETETSAIFSMSAGLAFTTVGRTRTTIGLPRTKSHSPSLLTLGLSTTWIGRIDVFDIEGY